MPGKVFISHKQLDSAAIAEKLFYTLENMGFEPWLDVNMPDRSVAGMEKGVKEAKFVIAICSDNYFSAKFCLQELQWAQEYQIPVVPVMNMDDKKKVGDFIAKCPEEFKWVGSINITELNRADIDYWKLGVKKMLEASNSAGKPPKKTKAEAAQVIEKMVAKGAIKSFCRNGHVMEALGTSRDNGWACDGMKLPQKCLKGCTGFKQTSGWKRWRCQKDDWDFCEKCADHYEQYFAAQADPTRAPQCFCPKGHKMEALGTGRDNGWACDGMKLADGCLKGCKGFKQTSGWKRWRCQQDDFDFCQKCALHYETRGK